MIDLKGFRIIIQELFQKPKVYPLDEAQQIPLTNYHLLVKAPKAAGTMLELKGFDAEDIEKLHLEFSCKSSLQPI